MKNSISHQLKKYLVKTTVFGIVCIAIVAVFFSISTHNKNHDENEKSLKYFVQNVMPAAAHFVSVNDMTKLKRQMDYYTQNESERNLQLQVKNLQGKVIYQSVGYDGKCNFPLFSVRKFTPICGELEIVSSDEHKPLGTLYATRNIRSFYSFFMEFFLPAFAIILFVFIALFFVMVRRFLKDNIVDPMNHLVKSLDENHDLEVNPHLRDKAYEWTVLYRAIHDYRKRITDYIVKQNKIHQDLEKEKILSDVTSQLAYDIRSPLEALDQMVTNFPEIDEKKRTLIRKATARIHEIANNLLSRSTTKSGDLSLQMISSLVRSVLFEKKEQYKANSKIMINENIDLKMYGTFAKIETNDFKNVLSHVIDNAVEAIKSSGFIRIAVTQSDDFITIDVFDNGKGIPPEILHRVTARGFTYNKDAGNGLGLYLADQKMREWGGRLEIESTVNSGTSVKMIFRKEQPPEWFMSEITLRDDNEYVILDDDHAIHELWEDRILQALHRNIKIHHFHDEQRFEDWFKKAGDQKEKALYFMDYELMGNNKSGLDIIENYNISSSSVLVTTHYENESIQQRCEKIGVRMIPKELANIVPIVSS